ncbi:hypothetical protein Aab01nite_20540 [Paractinoplanes abujensis]|uniref:Membrane-anchored protein YejM (Alkaline phosphatase superfamily) n=1 Tax=Paractinoplanes abujensis TaxID=882441 RepID=A0A7W7CYM5_9ACTN|nr:hypothetical protein [Actinoplanes abujensis]MBB4697062.1 membrane-anchored protein YejM (alkaline phosphatase superfamily) [Actinoplanes abujensis]GID18464.1 hypothetical protein Aab01nite_20540 [Actinoplanes abujensis]
MDFMAALFGFFIVQLPVLVVLVVGLALLGRPEKRLPGRSHTLARAGLIVLLIDTGAQTLFQLAFSRLVLQLDWSSTQFGLLSAVTSFLFTLLFAGGLGLLIAAFATIRSEAARAAEPPPADTSSVNPLH